MSNPTSTGNRYQTWQYLGSSSDLKDINVTVYTNIDVLLVGRSDAMQRRARRTEEVRRACQSASCSVISSSSQIICEQVLELRRE